MKISVVATALAATIVSAAPIATNEQVLSNGLSLHESNATISAASAASVPKVEVTLREADADGTVDDSKLKNGNCEIYFTQIGVTRLYNIDPAIDGEIPTFLGLKTPDPGIERCASHCPGSLSVGCNRIPNWGWTCRCGPWNGP